MYKARIWTITADGDAMTRTICSIRIIGLCDIHDNIRTLFDDPETVCVIVDMPNIFNLEKRFITAYTRYEWEMLREDKK